MSTRRLRQNARPSKLLKDVEAEQQKQQQQQQCGARVDYSGQRLNSNMPQSALSLCAVGRCDAKDTIKKGVNVIQEEITKVQPDPPCQSNAIKRDCRSDRTDACSLLYIGFCFGNLLIFLGPNPSS